MAIRCLGHLRSNASLMLSQAAQCLAACQHVLYITERGKIGSVGHKDGHFQSKFRHQLELIGMSQQLSAA